MHEMVTDVALAHQLKSYAADSPDIILGTFIVISRQKSLRRKVIEVFLLLLLIDGSFGCTVPVNEGFSCPVMIDIPQIDAIMRKSIPMKMQNSTH